MNDISGISYTAARFDKDGAALNKQEITLPQGTTDVIVASHGWNNTEEQAEQLYIPLFTNFAAVASDQLQNKKIAIVGVIWPSKKFTDVVDAAVLQARWIGDAGEVKDADSAGFFGRRKWGRRRIAWRSSENNAGRRRSRTG